MDEKRKIAEPMKPRRRWFQFRLRTMLIGVMLLSIPLAYVGSYYRLSRRGMREAREHGIAGFLYVPFDEAVATEDLTRHYRLMAFYAPLNWVDRELFGAEHPTGGVIWRLTP